MKLPRISYLLLLFIPFLSCDTKGDFEDDFKKYFIKYYGEDGDQEAVDFVVNNDGSVILLGKTDSPDGRKRILLIKVDGNGNALWQKILGSGKDSQGRDIDEGPQDIEPTIDGTGNFLIVSNMLRGKDPSTNEDILDFKVIRVDADGELVDSGMEWNNNLDPAIPDALDWKTQSIYSITTFSDGGFAVTGNSTNEAIYDDNGLITPPPDQEDIFAIGFTSGYNCIWSTTERRPTGGVTKAISRGEYTGCAIKVFQNGPDDFWVFSYSDAGFVFNQTLEYDLNFNILQVRRDGGSDGLPNGVSNLFAGEEGSNEILASVVRTTDGGFYEIGTSKSSTTATSGDLYFCKRNPNATKKVEGKINGLSGNLIAVSACPSLVSKSFLLLANEESANGKIIKLIKVSDIDRTTDQSEALWSANFGSPEMAGNKGAAVAELPSGRILVFATIELETQLKMALIKVNSKGELLN